MTQSDISTIIAALALGVSLATGIIHFFNYIKSRFNLKVEFDFDDSFYFDPIDISRGNCESLVVSIRIINNSNQPISISDIRIATNDRVVISHIKSSKYPYPTNLPNETFATLKSNDGYLLIKSADGDGYHILDLDNRLIKCPFYLKAYESTEGFIVFPAAGKSRSVTQFRIITSRKDKIISVAIPTKEEHENLFNYKIKK